MLLNQTLGTFGGLFRYCQQNCNIWGKSAANGSTIGARETMKVLIVEKETRLGRVWERQIREMGGWTILVDDKASAMNALAEISFDVLLLDLPSMPPEDMAALVDYHAR